MKIANGCLLLAFLLPYLCGVLAKSGRDFNNHAPREYYEKLTGWRKRAHWAGVNHFEMFAPFAVFLLIAQLSLAPQLVVNRLAVTFILARIFYTVFYVANKAALRTLSWLLGFVCVLGLFYMAM